MVLVRPSSNALVVVEDGRTYRLLCSVLSDYVIVDALLEVSGIELRNAEFVLVEHGTSAGLGRRIIAAREAGVEVLSASRCDSCDG